MERVPTASHATLGTSPGSRRQRPAASAGLRDDPKERTRPPGAVQLCAVSGLPPSPASRQHEDAATVLVGLAAILPICLRRDMSAMERCSIVKVAVLFSLLFAMVDLMSSSEYADGMAPTPREKWLEVRPGFARSLGSFVFTFVSQHTVNLTYESLRPELRTLRSWRAVSTLSILLSAGLSLALGLVLYATFWTDASSDMFSLYPAPSAPVALARLLLSVMIACTYPVTFLACRELCTPPPPPRRRGGGKAWWLRDADPRQLSPRRPTSPSRSPCGRPRHDGPRPPGALAARRGRPGRERRGDAHRVRAAGRVLVEDARPDGPGGGPDGRGRLRRGVRDVLRPGQAGGCGRQSMRCRSE